MILVDTSALLPFLAGRSTPASEMFADALSEGLEIALTPIVVQEVLQGAREELEWRKLKTYLLTQAILAPRDPIAMPVAAARIYYDCSRRGLTVEARSIASSLRLPSNTACLYSTTTAITTPSPE